MVRFTGWDELSKTWPQVKDCAGEEQKMQFKVNKRAAGPRRRSIIWLTIKFDATFGVCYFSEMRSITQQREAAEGAHYDGAKEFGLRTCWGEVPSSGVLFR